MTTHDLAVNVNVYPEEFKPIMKAVKYALLEGKDALFNDKEVEILEAFLDDFCSLALNEAV